MGTLSGFFVIVYFTCIIAIVIYVLRMLGRLVSALEKVAASLDMIAKKQKDEAKP